MNDTERAIKTLRKWSVKNTIIPDEDFPTFEMAISALEKQIPKKPREVVDEKGWEDWACPKCGVLIEGGSVMLHCWNCGQKLDWRVEE